MTDRRGSVAIDDEGTPGQYNVLIENGVLKGYMQDKLNALLQMEIEELKEKNNALAQDVQAAQNGREELERENNHLREQQTGWQDRLQALLGRMEEV
jgi:cell division protein ZapB